MPDETERKTHKVNPAKVDVGHYMALTYWVRVKEVRSLEHLVVDDLDAGTPGIHVKGRDLIVNAYSADQFEEEVKTTKTAAAELLVSSFARPITVAFVKDGGEDRVMKCRLVRAEPLLGRSMVEDLEIADPKKRIRLVDHRTLKWIITDGVKYVVK